MVSCRFLVAALVYLLLGLMVQTVHMADLTLGLSPLNHTTTSLVLQLLLVGWLTQAVVGMLYGGVIKSPRASTAVWWCLNLGLVAAIVGQPLLVLTGNRVGGALLLGGGLLQMAGGAAFAADVAATLRSASGAADRKSSSGL